MELVITPRLTLTNELPQSVQGRPVGVVTLDSQKIVVTPHTEIELENAWTTPGMVVLQWLYGNGGTPEQKVFASRFINPHFVAPT